MKILLDKDREPQHYVPEITEQTNPVYIKMGEFPGSLDDKEFVVMLSYILRGKTVVAFYDDRRIIYRRGKEVAF